MSSAEVTLIGPQSLESIQTSAQAAGLNTHIISENSIDVYSLDTIAVQKWVNINQNPNVTITVAPIIMAPRQKQPSNHHYELKPRSVGVPYFYMNHIKNIYNIPNPNPTVPVCVGVVSFGGGLYGSIDANGVLTNGDVQAYWTAIGISTQNQPRVIVIPVFGATNQPNINDGGATLENTLDVETIGGACPSANLTIILYIAPNSLNQFPALMNYIYTTPKVVNSVSYKPTIVSISWGAPEIYYGTTLINSINSTFLAMTNAGMNITVATGDNGSNDGVGGSANYVDYPSSSPYTTAVGGTSLTCPNNIYDTFTNEAAWNSGGGGVSTSNSKPVYQSALTVSGRSTPDIAAVADPNTGVVFLVNGVYEIIGGTSVAAPIVAAFLAAINYNSFVNPRLYAAPSSCYHDITTGSNGAFSANSGYDNCTGFGTLNGSVLANVLTNVIATSMTVSPGSLTLTASQTTQLVPTILPANVTTRTVHYVSSNTSVATVTNGIVVAIAIGTANITVSTTDGSNINVVVPVTVTSSGQNIPVTGVMLNLSNATLHPTNTVQLVATVSPLTATNQTVFWSSSNPSISTVNQSGLATAVSIGQATITVSTTDGNKTATSLINVTVPVSSVAISPASSTLSVGQSKQLTALVLPSNAGNRTVTWSSSNTNIATVNVNGGVYAVGNGTATITATTNDLGFTSTATIIVNTAVQRITVSPTEINVLSGQTRTLTATITPPTASNTTIFWASSITSIATVNQSGVVTGRGNGSCLITATTQDGNKKATIIVRVSTAVTGVSLDLSTLTLGRNNSQNLTATITPANASNKTLLWSTNNGNVATVSNSGRVRGGNPGQATITVRTQEGGYTASCVVTVN